LFFVNQAKYSSTFEAYQSSDEGNKTEELVRGYKGTIAVEVKWVTCLIYTRECQLKSELIFDLATPFKEFLLHHQIPCVIFFFFLFIYLVNVCVVVKF
jgi:hypothetical protein